MSSQPTASVQLPPSPPKSFLAYILTVPFIVVFIGILIVFDPLLRLARVVAGLNGQKKVAEYLNHFLLLSTRMMGTKVQVEGAVAIDRNSPYVIISNHQSLYDIILLADLFRENPPGFVAKKELAERIPSVSYNLRRGYNVLIDRTDAKQALGAIDAFAAFINRDRGAVVIFPEGTRARDGVLKKFRSSGVASLLENAPDAAVIPVTIDGSWKVLAYRCWPIPFGIQVRVKIGKTLNRKDFPDLRALRAEAFKTVQENLAAMRTKTVA